MVSTSTKYTIKKAKATLNIELGWPSNYDSEHPITGTIKINTNQQFAAYGVQISVVRKEKIYYTDF